MQNLRQLLTFNFNYPLRHLIMVYSQYLRIQTIAGGIGASNRQIIKAVRSMLNADALTNSHKLNRHKIYRLALNHHHNQLNRGF